MTHALDQCGETERGQRSAVNGEAECGQRSAERGETDCGRRWAVNGEAESGEAECGVRLVVANGGGSVADAVPDLSAAAAAGIDAAVGSDSTPHLICYSPRSLGVAVYLSVVLALAGVFVGLPGAAQARVRAKINSVQIKDAPQLFIDATAVDTTGHVLSVGDVSHAQVFADGEVVDEGASFVEDVNEAVVAVVVIPAYEGFAAEGLKGALACVEQVAGALTTGDRLGIVAYGEGAEVVAEISEQWTGAAAQAGDAQVRGLKQGGRPQLFMGIAKALEMTAAAKAPRTVVVVVSDGADAQLASPVKADQKLKEIATGAREQGSVLMTVGYLESSQRSGRRALEVLARKTKGTFRSADAAELVAGHCKSAILEMKHPLRVKAWARLAPFQVHKIGLNFRHGDEEVQAFGQEVRFEGVGNPWLRYGLFAGAALAALTILFLVGRLVLGWLKKRKARKEAQEQQLAKVGKTLCPQCQQVVREEWTECLFCKKPLRSMAQIKKCSKCQNVVMPDWTVCLYCQHPLVDAKAAGQPLVGDQGGSGGCPHCGRKVMSEWKVCFFCNAILKR